jgi:hypothetical protein
MTVISDQLRREVVARADQRCEYCRLPQAGQVATFPVDHVLPRTRGGQTVFENLALACPHCNSHKWAFVDGVDERGRATPLFNPRVQVWREHFEWSAADGVTLVGKTEVGTATIARLQMNAGPMVLTRRLLLELGIKLDPE